MREWEHPGRGPRDGTPQFEIPLAGDDPVVGDDQAPTAPNWRKVAGLSALAGVALGVVAAVVILTASGDADDGGAPTTTVDADELSPSITVPPTLTPVEPDGTEADGRGIDPLPTIAGADPDSLGAYDLDAALTELDENAPRRSHTRYVAGADGFVLDVNVVHDSLNDRYRIELEFDADDPDRQRLLLDARGEWSYATAGEFWLRIPNEEIVHETAWADVAALARSILLGPVRSDTSPAVVAIAGLASLDGTPVREFTVEVAAGTVPEWTAYLFAPSAEVPPVPAADQLTYTVHVDGNARLRRVAGASDYGNTQHTIVHTVVRMPRLEVIDLPTSFAILGENGEVITDSVELVPEYEPAAVDPAAGEYDLGAALANVTESPPLRATVAMLGDTTTVTTAERDPTTGVVSVTFGAIDEASLLIETTSGRVFTATGDGSYEQDRLVDGDAFSVALLEGAIEPETLIDAEPVAFVRRDDRTLRRYDTTVPAAALRPLLSPGFGSGLDRSAPVPVRVFVDEASRVVELHVLSTGGVPQALVQRFEHDVEAPTVTLPVDSG